MRDLLHVHKMGVSGQTEFHAENSSLLNSSIAIQTSLTSLEESILQQAK